MAEDGPRSKAEMMERVYARWDELQVLLGQLSDKQMEQPLGDGWSAKVHLGHITAWERSTLGLLRGQDRAIAMGLDPGVYGTLDTEALNALLAARAEELPLAQVRTEAEQVHSELIGLVESMSEAEMSKPYSHYQPNDPPHNATPVFAWVNGNTWDHYQEHIGWLREGLRT